MAYSGDMYRGEMAVPQAELKIHRMDVIEKQVAEARAFVGSITDNVSRIGERLIGPERSEQDALVNKQLTKNGPRSSIERLEDALSGLMHDLSVLNSRVGRLDSL